MMSTAKNPNKKWIVAGAATVLTGVTAVTSIFSVDAGSVGIVKSGGNISRVEGPGWGMRWPIVQSVEKFDTKQRTLELNDISVYYSAKSDESVQKSTDGTPEAQHANLTEGSQETHHKITIIYQVAQPDVKSVREKIGQEELVEARIKKTAESIFKGVASDYNPLQLASARGVIETKTKENLIKALDGTGITVVDMRHNNFDFNPIVKSAYEEAVRKQAEVKAAEAEKAKADIQAKTAKIVAEGEANAAREKARGEADAIALKGKAEAESIEQRGKALRDNPAIIQLETAKQWNGVLPYMMVPGGSVPMLNLGDLMKQGKPAEPEKVSAANSVFDVYGVYRMNLGRQRCA